MKKFCFLLIMGLAVSAWADFLPGTEDIPALDDMIFSEDILSFDVPEGQILIVNGTTDQTQAEIERFYTTNLTALGWKKKTNSKFVRGNDQLSIDIETVKSHQNVKFSLTLSND